MVIIVWNVALPFSAEEEPENRDVSEEEDTGGMKTEKEEKEEHLKEPVEFPDTVVEMSHIGGVQWVFCHDFRLVSCSHLFL